MTDGLIVANPCHIRGAGASKRVHKIKPASLGELEVIVKAIPDRYALMVLLGAWCALRFGELAELRRRDVDLEAGKIMIRRAVGDLRGIYRGAQVEQGHMVEFPCSASRRREASSHGVPGTSADLAAWSSRPLFVTEEPMQPRCGLGICRTQQTSLNNPGASDHTRQDPAVSRPSYPGAVVSIRVVWRCHS